MYSYIQHRVGFAITPPICHQQHSLTAIIRNPYFVKKQQNKIFNLRYVNCTATLHGN
jgi:hypothetical protein